MHRRQFLALAGLATSSALLRLDAADSAAALDAFIQRKMQADHIPGVAACLIKDDRIIWSKAYGWAHLQPQLPMTLDHLLNIGSVSKTFTTTALMQLWEQKAFALDDNVSRFLSFSLQHPLHPRAPITFRLLLTHRSALRDGPAYARAYACGDPALPAGNLGEGILPPDWDLLRRR